MCALLLVLRHATVSILEVIDSSSKESEASDAAAEYLQKSIRSMMAYIAMTFSYGHAIHHNVYSKILAFSIFKLTAKFTKINTRYAYHWE